jgi:hypothetical protein
MPLVRAYIGQGLCADLEGLKGVLCLKTICKAYKIFQKMQ